VINTGDHRWLAFGGLKETLERNRLSKLKEQKVGQGKGICGEMSRETRSPVINTSDRGGGTSS